MHACLLVACNVKKRTSMKYSNHEMLKAIQFNTNATHPKQSISKKNELPLARPVTFCIICSMCFVSFKKHTMINLFFSPLMCRINDFYITRRDR